jgi:hypothetical protein
MLNRRILGIALALAGVLFVADVRVAWPNKKNEVQTADGIRIGQPKIYDNGTLQSMLNADLQQLAAMQFLNQAGVAANIGALQGAASQQSSFSVQAQGAPLPQVASTVNSSTAPGSAVTTATTTTQAAATPSIPSLATSGSPAMPTSYAPGAIDILNQQMQLNYEVMNLRLLLEGALNDRFTKPCGGAITSGNCQKPKRVATIGFSISIDDPPSSRFDNAVAEVTVTVNSSKNSDNTPATEPPGIMTILPRERTYNEATITDKSSGFGLAVVTQVFSVGVAGSHRNQTYRIVQDYDTVAFVGSQTNCGTGAVDACSTTFGWQFRPTLGRKKIVPGLRQVFAQLSFPAGDPTFNSDLGGLVVKAHWRTFDPKTGSVGRVITADANGPKRNLDEQLSTSSTEAPVILATSPSAVPLPVPLPNFDLRPYLGYVAWSDAGSGQVFVEASGTFLEGTYVDVGGTPFKDGTAGFVSSPHSIRFVAPAVLLVGAEDARLIAPSGDEIGLDKVADSKVADSKGNELFVESARAIPWNDTDYIVEVSYRGANPGANTGVVPLVLIGGTVFGLSDHPVSAAPHGCLEKGACTLTFHAPVTLVQSARSLKLKQMFYGPHEEKVSDIEIVADFGASKLVPMAKNAECSMYAIQGYGFDAHTQVSAGGVMLGAKTETSCDFSKPGPPAPQPAKKDPPARGGAKKPSSCEFAKGYMDATLAPTTLVIAIPNCELTQAKTIEVRDGVSQMRSVILPLPTDQTKSTVTKPTIGPITVKVGDANFKVTGTNLKLIDPKGVSYTCASLPAYMAEDSSYLVVAVMPCFPQTPGYYPITFKLMDGKTTVTALAQVVKAGS